MSRYINPYTDFGFKRLFGEPGILEITRNMKREGFEIAVIAKMTGLSPKEIAA